MHTPKFSLLTPLFLLHYLTPSTLAFTIQCVDRPMTVAPVKDCEAVLGGMYSKIAPWGPKHEWPPIWTSNLPTDIHEGIQTLPQGFQLDPEFPPPAPQPEPNRCHIKIDNIPGKEGIADQFGYQTIVDAVKAMMDQCYKQGTTGTVDPTGNAAVYITTIYRNLGQEEPVPYNVTKLTEADIPAERQVIVN